MITIKERNGLTINTPDAGEKTLFLDTDSKLKTKDESGVIEEVSIVSATTPKVYKALLTQGGSDDPTAVVLENTLGGTIIWTRNDIGKYTGTLVGAFPENKTSVRPTIERNSDSTNVGGYRLDDDTVVYDTYLPTGSNYDNSNVNILIEVYP